MELTVVNHIKTENFPTAKEIRKAVSTVLKKCGKKVTDPYEISLMFVDRDEIRAMNKQFRGIDRATDVISFAFCDGEGSDFAPFLLGDIAICVDIVSDHGKKYGTGLKKETIFVIVHGVLHLLGYDHGAEAQRKKMRALETEIMSTLFQ
jgi:probable rRNA maturation factor